MSHYLLVLTPILGIECAGLVGCIMLYQKAPTLALKKVAAALFSLLALFDAIVWYGLDVTPRTPAVIFGILSVLIALGGLQTLFARRNN